MRVQVDILATSARRRRLLDAIPRESWARLRREAGLSAIDIAQAVGVTRQTIHLWERGARRPSGARGLAYLELLAEIAGVH